jgi:hypothetical protein
MNWNWTLDRRQLRQCSDHQELVHKLRQEIRDGQMSESLSEGVEQIIVDLEQQPQTVKQRTKKLKEKMAGTSRSLYCSEELTVCSSDHYPNSTVVVTDALNSRIGCASQLESWTIVRNMRAECFQGKTAREDYCAVLSLVFIYNAVLINLAQPLYRLSVSKTPRSRRWQKPNLNQLFENSQEMALHLSNSLILANREFLKPYFL